MIVLPVFDPGLALCRHQPACCGLRGGSSVSELVASMPTRAASTLTGAILMVHPVEYVGGFGAEASASPPLPWKNQGSAASSSRIPMVGRIAAFNHRRRVSTSIAFIEQRAGGSRDPDRPQPPEPYRSV